MSHVGLIIKATRLCNLRCAYCHDWRSEADHTMTFAVLATLTARALQDPAHTSVDFIWHGGEPTILPISFYQKALYLQARFRRAGQLVQNILQTNATRLTPTWIDFFKTYRIGLGISIDGPELIHDKYRKYASGKPSFAEVAKGLRLLKESGIGFTILMVIDEDTLHLGADYVFDFILSHGIQNISCIAAKPTNYPSARAGTAVSHYSNPIQMTRFLSRLFDRWLDHGDFQIKIRELTAITNRLKQKPAGTCTLAGECLGRYYLVEATGEIAHCDLFLGDPLYTLGNVMQDSFAAIRGSPALRLLQEQNNQALRSMQSCGSFSVCRGWCPHERYLAVRHSPSHRENCCGLSELIAHVRNRLESRQSGRSLSAVANDK